MRSKANNDLLCLHEEVSLGESLPGRCPGSAAGSDKGGVLNGTGLICLQCRQLLSSVTPYPTVAQNALHGLCGHCRVKQGHAAVTQHLGDCRLPCSASREAAGRGSKSRSITDGIPVPQLS